MLICQTCKLDESSIHYGEKRLCLQCYNTLMTPELGVKATRYLEELTLRDGLGDVHRFRLRKRLDPAGVFVEANEQVDGGYHFQVHGNLRSDQERLLLQLLDKAETGMAEMYVEKSLFEDGGSNHHLRNGRLAGRVEWNPADEVVPLLVVDGNSYTWEQIGKMLMHYEGFQLKLQLVDPYEEIEWDNSEPKKEQGQ